MSNNNIVYQARLHWVLFFWPLALFLAACVMGYEFPSFYPVALVVGGFSIIWLVMIWATYEFSSLTIKEKQVILRQGILVRKTTDISLDKIESIDIRQSILGSLLQYGSLVITGTGGSRQEVSYINKPLTCRRYIEQLLHH